MQTDPSKPTTISAYIAQFEPDLQQRLNSLAETIRQAAPDAEERIAYRMPGFYLNGPLIYFAAYKNHIGIYPLPAGIAQFAEQLAPYKHSKGSVQFPLDEALPLDLIAQLVAARVADKQAKDNPKGH